MENKYQSTVEWMFSQVPMFQNVGQQAYKPGLDGILKLTAAFGNPHQGLRTVHVGGTNGKGSVSSLLASVFQEQGLKTGLFTSPHLVDFRERIRIDGEMISEEGVVEFIERFRRSGLDYEPSFFELTTVMAFDWFRRNNVDIAVIEVGLGGRLDSTNIITPELSVITNISFDHTAQLGNTLEAIAAEKAGIIKGGIPAVIGNAAGAVRRVFEDKARGVGAPIVFAQDRPGFSETETRDTYNIYIGTEWGDIECPLTGDCQRENAATAFNALHALGHRDSASVRAGFRNVTANTGLTGRWTTLRRRPDIICDTGHNQGGWAWLGARLRRIADEAAEGGASLRIVAGFVNDKDTTAIFGEMPRNAAYYWATPSVARGRDAADVAAAARQSGLEGSAYPTVADALGRALEEATEADTIFVGGSTFIVADLLKALPQDARRGIKS